MIRTMAEAKCKRNADRSHDQGHGLHDYASVGEAQVALENSGVGDAALDEAERTKMARWMWRNDASPEDAATAFGVKLPRDTGYSE